MAWSIASADVLQRKAFPWGAHVTVPSGSAFLSVRYDVVEIQDGPDRATLRFERDPGDTVQVVDRIQLERAATTHELEFDGGGGGRQPATGDLHLLASPFRDLIGPQAPSDSKWVARMRLHQSWWRTFRLRAAFGTGPTPKSTKRYGNMLDGATADAGLNFLTADARASYDARVALTHKGVDPWRTRRNLLASQPLAFNLFGHLSRHLEIAAAMFRELLGDDEVDAVTSVEVERLSNALGDRTAFDAFATYHRPNGTPACIAIETKLTEPFSQQAYNWDYYRAHATFDPEVWTTSDTTLLGDRRWSQLWRNHLLARAESAANPLLGPPTALIVHHPRDPHCADNVGAYRALLRDPDRVRAVDLRAIGDILSALVVGDDDQERWVADLSARYLELELSAPLVGLEDWASREE